MVISRDMYEKDGNVSPFEALPQSNDPIPPSHPPKVAPLISLNALTGIYAPQTLNLIGYIKNKKFIILFDNRNTHNFMHRCISQETPCYIPAINNFKIMITN